MTIPRRTHRDARAADTSPATSRSIHPSICRFCPACCGILVEVEGGRAVRVTGDRDDPVYRGFTCPKGRQLPAQHAHPDRLLHPMKRAGEGSHRPIPSERALDEIAARIAAIAARHGPRSVALYVGTLAGSHPTASAAAVGWLLALGSPMVFTAATIDQPGKSIANALHGRWLAGPYLFDEADAWLLVGANPLVSMSGGLSPANPARRLRDAWRRGMELIVIDPRRTETVRFASAHLQPRPGNDPLLLASMLHVILREGLEDRAFLDENATGLEPLAAAVAPFDPATAAARAGVAADDLVRAARAFARARRACAVAGTGPNMSGHGNLTEYLLLCLLTVCGHWRRAGEALPNPGVLATPATPRAEPSPPRPAWGFGERLRVRGLGQAASGLPTAALAEEILLEGEGQVRALVCVGGNPAVSWPDQRRAVEALRSLELLVTIDVEMSATARLAHYVIAPRLSLEVPGFSLPLEGYEQFYLATGHAEPYARYTPAVVEPPPGADVLEEWEVFYGLARRMGLGLRLVAPRAEVGVLRDRRRSIELDMERKPTTDEIYERMARGSRVPLAEVKRHPHGLLAPGEAVIVAPRRPGCDARLELGDAAMLAELAGLTAAPARSTPAGDGLPFRLVSRRMAQVYNSSGHRLEALHGGRASNPAYLHPADLDALGVREGDVVRIASAHGSIRARAARDPGLRRGIVSIAHCFGGLPGETGEDGEDAARGGANTGRLLRCDAHFDPHTGIPLMSGVPVSVEPESGAARSARG